MDKELTTLIAFSDSESKRSIDPITKFMTIKDCILAGAGVLGYRHKEVFADSDRSDLVYIDRPTEVFTQQYVDSWNGKDITFIHTFLDSTNATKKTVGIVINPQFADGQLIGDLVIKDQETIDELNNPKNKDKYSLSVGQYAKSEDADYEVDGKKISLKQTELISNHLAIETNPRYKLAKISDSETVTATATPETKPAETKTEFTDSQKQEIEKLAIKLSDERVKMLSRVKNTFADYDGTSKTGREVMIDVINSAKKDDYCGFSEIYKSCFSEMNVDSLNDIALNIMFNVALGVSTYYRIKLEPMETATVTVAEGAQAPTAMLDRDSFGKDNLKFIKTQDSKTEAYVSPRDAYIQHLKGTK